jgi:tyrosyl-tRNA synthetase
MASIGLVGLGLFPWVMLCYPPAFLCSAIERDEMPYRSDFLATLSSRGYIHQVTDGDAIDALAVVGKLVGYIGFDCTAPSLHIGSLVQIMMLRRLQQSGNKPIVLMGGGTTRVGDPSGKDESRKLLTDADIAANMASIKTVFERYLTFGDGPTDAVMVNNADWLDKLGYIDVLRDVGLHFTINRMLTFDSVKLRLDREQPLTFLEFNYMILQAYDYLELNRRMGCSLQMGGSDQWGNIVNGTELIRRKDGRDAHGLTTPLLTTSDGAKMGKTASGAVWLNEDQLPAYDFWQYWRNVPDADVGRLLRLFTELPLDEIDRLEALQGAEINSAKIVLATQITQLARGEVAAAAAEGTARSTFEQASLGADLPRLAVAGPIGLADAMVQLGLVATKGEAKRLIAQGGARIDDEPVTDIQAQVMPTAAGVKLSAGKKKHGVVTL